MKASVFDAHLHIIDPRFPLLPPYTPPQFTVRDYAAALEHMDLAIEGGIVVSGSFQGFDQTYAADALQELRNATGRTWKAVVQMPASSTDSELARAKSAGIQGVRFNVFRGGSAPVSELASFGERLTDAGLHVELYVDAAAIDAKLAGVIRHLKRASIDHLGLTREGVPRLLSLAEAGVRVKATGFGRLDFDPLPVLKDLYAANPSCLMFGTDLPSTRARVPFRREDVRLIADNFAPDAARNILALNAVQFYEIEGS